MRNDFIIQAVHIVKIKNYFVLDAITIRNNTTTDYIFDNKNQRIMLENPSFKTKTQLVINATIKKDSEIDLPTKDVCEKENPFWQFVVEGGTVLALKDCNNKTIDYAALRFDNLNKDSHILIRHKKAKNILFG